jgi:hypothetical protein
MECRFISVRVGLLQLQVERAEWFAWKTVFTLRSKSIRNEPEFKAVFANIERDMAQQRARLARRPKDAALDLAASVDQ